jgi:uncharacterized membrane protein YhaH (DUF805 family)
MNLFRPIIGDVRVKRTTYFFYSFGIFLLGLLLSIFVEPRFEAFVYVLAGLLNIWLAMNRTHDIGKTSAWVLLFCVPFVNLIVGLVLFFAPGTNGPNKYGEERI